jgi:hypothetical protein
LARRCKEHLADAIPDARAPYPHANVAGVEEVRHLVHIYMHLSILFNGKEVPGVEVLEGRVGGGEEPCILVGGLEPLHEVVLVGPQGGAGAARRTRQQAQQEHLGVGSELAQRCHRLVDSCPRVLPRAANADVVGADGDDDGLGLERRRTRQLAAPYSREQVLRLVARSALASSAYSMPGYLVCRGWGGRLIHRSYD